VAKKDILDADFDKLKKSFEKMLIKIKRQVARKNG